MRYYIPKLGEVQIQLYDLRGRAVKILASGVMTAGYHDTKVNAEGLAAGLYILKLRTTKEVKIEKIAILK